MHLALMKWITLTEHPELYQLLKEDESLANFLKMSPEEILLRWLNYQLKKADSSRVATKFAKDLSDSEILTTVLKQIEPECCTLAPLHQTDLWQHADGMLAETDKIDCRKFIGAKEIVQGHARLKLAFVANLFNTQLHFSPPSSLGSSAFILVDDTSIIFRPARAKLRAGRIQWPEIYDTDGTLSWLVAPLRVKVMSRKKWQGALYQTVAQLVDNVYLMQDVLATMPLAAAVTHHSAFVAIWDFRELSETSPKL
jgi:hypothetical protein